MIHEYVQCMVFKFVVKRKIKGEEGEVECIKTFCFKIGMKGLRRNEEKE